MRVKVLRGYDLLQAEASSQMDDESDRVGGWRCKSRSRHLLQTYRREGGKWVAMLLKWSILISQRTFHLSIQIYLSWRPSRLQFRTTAAAWWMLASRCSQLSGPWRYNSRARNKRHRCRDVILNSVFHLSASFSQDTGDLSALVDWIWRPDPEQLPL